MWADDPADRLLPTPETMQSLRAFANHAMGAIESARQLELMRHLAEHDPLTGLRNRRGLQEHIDAEIARTGTVAVLVCDLDNFKRVNDALGYVQGDEALRRFAGVLAGAGGLAARLGGEEFALVLPAPARTLRSRPPSASAPRCRRCSTTSRGRSRPRSASPSAARAPRRRRCCCAPPRARCSAPSGSAATAASPTTRRRSSRCSARSRTPAARPSEQLAAAMLLAETLDLRDVGTARHSQTVGRYAEAIARALDLPAGRVDRIRAAGVLHDIGKLGVADAVLKKPGKLTDEEWAEMRRHPELGARILHHANLRDISAWVLAHHERIDGGGYPHGLAGDDDPARGADPRGRRRVRGDDRRPRLPRRARARRGSEGAAGVRRHAVRPARRRRVPARAEPAAAGLEPSALGVPSRAV